MRYFKAGLCLLFSFSFNNTFFVHGEEPMPEAKPTVYMVSTAHLDTQWNWDIQSTVREYVWNTLNQNLYLLEKYPEYVFNFEGGVKYSWMKEYFPREYGLLKKYIADGRWHLTGSSWDATDAIVPSVESALRNILLAQTFYREEFGTESTDIFLPDCFGFGWTLPTVAAHCGLIGFSSQKLQWRVNPFYGDRRYPFTVGLWQGIDGSRIMMAHGYPYTTHWQDEDLTQNTTVAARVNDSPLRVGMHYYGTGDIGGSPTIGSVEAVVGATVNDGPVKVLSVTSDSLYKHFMPYDSHPELPVFDGELTMDVHGTGCYTSQAAMKLYNRRNEMLGDAAERASVAAELLGQVEYPTQTLTDAWRRFIFHQFHDDLTGTSIPRAYEFSWNDELISLKHFASVLENASAGVAEMLDTRTNGIPVVLYNALAHEVTDVVEIDIPAKYRPAKAIVKGAKKEPLKSQVIGYQNGKARILVEATVPPCGYAVIDVSLSGKSNATPSAAANELTNSRYKLTFNDAGDITSLVDIDANREYVADGKAIRLAMFEQNESFSWPAWEVVKETVDREPVSIVDDCEITSVENGPLRHTLRIRKRYGDSEFVQYVRLYEGHLADRIDFYNEIDWATTNALLKAEFPLSVANEEATYDLGLGSIRRGNNVPTAYEVYAQRWADLTDRSDEYGLTIMNDCKYGWDKPADNIIRLTLLHTPKTRSGYSYQNRQDFGHHTFTYSLLPHNGNLNQAQTDRRADQLNQSLKAFVTEKHPGKLGRTFSLAVTDNPHIAVKAIKKAECSDEYVVRIYETSGKDSRTGTISFPFAITGAVRADGTEKTIGEAVFNGNTLDVEVGKNGIATYKLTFDKPDMSERAEYYPVPLAYDKKCYSWNGFESDGDFSEGYTYAGELIPSYLKAGNVPFTLETKARFNGKKCVGDTISFPKGEYNRLYILAACASETSGCRDDVKVGKYSATLTVPSYTGFVGQWGHTGHTEGYLYDDEIAFVGTHRHSPAGDEPYEFTYMFRYCIDIPSDVSYIVLPDNPNLVIFAATLAEEDFSDFKVASQLFPTGNKQSQSPAYSIADSARNHDSESASLVNASNLIGWSGYVNEREHPRFMHDGDTYTKWCDVSGMPAYVDYDLGAITPVSDWQLLFAGIENQGYIASTCMLQVRNSKDEEWRTVDRLLSNRRNRVTRRLNTPVEARYVRLLVVQPEQSADGPATRIYEFAVH